MRCSAAAGATFEKYIYTWKYFKFVFDQFTCESFECKYIDKKSVQWSAVLTLKNSVNYYWTWKFGNLPRCVCALWSFCANKWKQVNYIVLEK